MKKVLVGLVTILVVFSSSLVFAEDTVISIKVPSTFTEANITYVKEMASIGIQRILEAPLVPDVKLVEDMKTEVDRLRTEIGLEKKFSKDIENVEK